MPRTPIEYKLLQDIQGTTSGKKKKRETHFMTRKLYKLLQDIQATVLKRKKKKPILMPRTPIEYKYLRDIQATNCGKRETIHDWAQTRLFPHTIVPRHDHAYTR